MNNLDKSNIEIMILMWSSQTKPLIIINKMYKVLHKLMKTVLDVSSIIRAVLYIFVVPRWAVILNIY